MLPLTTPPVHRRGGSVFIPLLRECGKRRTNQPAVNTRCLLGRLLPRALLRRGLLRRRLLRRGFFRSTPGRSGLLRRTLLRRRLLRAPATRLLWRPGGALVQETDGFLHRDPVRIGTPRQRGVHVPVLHVRPVASRRRGRSAHRRAGAHRSGEAPLRHAAPAWAAPAAPAPAPARPSKRRHPGRASGTHRREPRRGRSARSPPAPPCRSRGACPGCAEATALQRQVRASPDPACTPLGSEARRGWLSVVRGCAELHVRSESSFHQEDGQSGGGIGAQRLGALGLGAHQPRIPARSSRSAGATPSGIDAVTVGSALLHLHERTELPDPDRAGKVLQLDGGGLARVDLPFAGLHLGLQPLGPEEEIAQIGQPLGIARRRSRRAPPPSAR